MQKFKTATSEQLSRLTFAQPVQSDGHEKKLFSCHLQVGKTVASLLESVGRFGLMAGHLLPHPWRNRSRTIRQSVANGCIPMLNDHVIQLYGQVPVGTPVTAL
jgi:hypothetical protein